MKPATPPPSTLRPGRTAAGDGCGPGGTGAASVRGVERVRRWVEWVLFHGVAGPTRIATSSFAARRCASWEGWEPTSGRVYGSCGAWCGRGRSPSTSGRISASTPRHCARSSGRVARSTLSSRSGGCSRRCGAAIFARQPGGLPGGAVEPRWHVHAAHALPRRRRAGAGAGDAGARVGGVPGRRGRNPGRSTPIATNWPVSPSSRSTSRATRSNSSTARARSCASCRPIVQIEDNGGGGAWPPTCDRAGSRVARCARWSAARCVTYDVADGRGQVNFYLVPRDGGSDSRITTPARAVQRSPLTGGTR